MTATLSNKKFPLEENELRSYARDLILSLDYCFHYKIIYIFIYF